MKNKKALIITITIMSVIFISLICVSIGIATKGKRVKKSDTLYIEIYQYNVKDFHFDKSKERVLYDRFEFNKDTTYDKVITSLDGKITNHVVCENGEVYVKDATCANHICMQSTITLEINNVFNPLSISCFPAGLYIVLVGE